MNAFIGLASGDPGFTSRWAEVCREGQREHDAWVADLRARGIKAAHPDDGWVDRENSTVHLCYPQFDLGVSVGDLLALGSPGGKTRIVKVVGFIKGMLGVDRWRFEEVATTTAATQHGPTGEVKV